MFPEKDSLLDDLNRIPRISFLTCIVVDNWANVIRRSKDSTLDSE